MSTGLGDVGGWFRTAGHGTLRHRVVWEPTGDGFGRLSPRADLDAALALFQGRPAMVLTGAGMSTDSGLPDYRGRDAVPRAPMTYQEFVGSDLSRRRYWARSTAGWAWFERAQPNPAHRALARLAHHTPLTGIVTQNVDSLHQAAGSSPVVDLHGSLSRVVCLDCGALLSRGDLQGILLSLNPGIERSGGPVAPDGDAEADFSGEFYYPGCPDCGGMLKPDVVFFGENTRPEVAAAAGDLLDTAEALLVLGTSLSVMSGLRFVRRAAKQGKPIVIVGDGPTRGDELATIRIHGRLGPVLSHWLDGAQTSAAGQGQAMPMGRYHKRREDP